VKEEEGEISLGPIYLGEELVVIHFLNLFVPMWDIHSVTLIHVYDDYDDDDYATTTTVRTLPACAR